MHPQAAAPPLLEAPRKEPLESKAIDIPDATLQDLLSPQQQSNTAPQSLPLTPLDPDIVGRPSSSCPEEPTPSAEASKGRTSEPEHVVEWSPNQRYGKLNTILGKGAYKVVWKAVDKEEGIEVAWNSLPSTKSEFNEFSQEIDILKKVRHPNIIHLHDYWFSDGDFVFITELMTSGTLREYIKKVHSPSIRLIKRWARQVLKGLAYLHSLSPPIIHRDIKCDNIFVNGAHNEIKIGDMGTAKMKHGKKYTVIGTPEFMAPEMYEERGYNEKVDIYALGMCLLEMVTGEYPYAECKNAAQVYKKVTNGIKPECLAKVDDKDVMAVINGCLVGEHERWSAKRLLEHAFFAEEPDVTLVTVDDSRTKLVLQLSFKGVDRHSIKFDFNTSTDTADRVVREMIDEELLPCKLQTHVTNELIRIVRDIAKTVPMQTSSKEALAETAPPSEGPADGTKKTDHEQQQPPHTQTLTSPNSTLYAAVVGLPKKTAGEIKFEPFTKDYPDQCTVEEFVLDVAIHCNRSAEKAAEWIRRLKAQDIDTVGDLHRLQEDDWIKLNLTVFATRALRNALAGRQVAAAMTSPRSNSNNASLEAHTDH